MNPKVSVQILNYNGKKFLKDCINSLLNQNYDNFEIILVDNASKDGSIQFIQENYSLEIKKNKIKILSFNKNYGFAEGYNKSYERARADYVLLINNDTISDSNLIKELVKKAESEKNIACVGGAIFPFGTNLKTAKIGEMGALSLLMTNTLKKSSKENLFYVSGCCCLINKKLIKRPFDGDYFAYSEDVYLGWLSNLLGYKCLLEEKAKLLHYGSGTAGTGSPFIRYYGERNRILNCLIFYEKKTLSRIFPLILEYVIISGAFFIQRPKVFVAYLKAYAWLISHPGLILKKRREMQKIRKIADDKIVKMLSSQIFLTKPKLTSFYNKKKKNSLSLNLITKISEFLDYSVLLYCKIFNLKVFELNK